MCKWGASFFYCQSTKNVDEFLAQVIGVHAGVGVSVESHSHCQEMLSSASYFEEQGVPLCTWVFKTSCQPSLGQHSSKLTKGLINQKKISKSAAKLQL